MVLTAKQLASIKSNATKYTKQYASHLSYTGSEKLIAQAGSDVEALLLYIEHLQGEIKQLSFDLSRTTQVMNFVRCKACKGLWPSGYVCPCGKGEL